MFTEITTETASTYLYPGYHYEDTADGKIHASDKAGEDPVNLILPKKLPWDKDGDPFVPGCNEIWLSRRHPIYGALGCPLDDNEVSISMSTGILHRYQDGRKPDYEYRPAGEAEDILLFVEYDDEQAPTMRGMDCDFANEYQVKLYFSVADDKKPEDNPEVTVRKTDIWILPKCDMFATTLQDAADEYIEQVIGGDVYAATFHRAASVYREYIEKTLEPKLAAIDHRYYLEYNEESAELFQRLYLTISDFSSGKKKSSERGAMQVGRYRYTLKGAQDLAAHIIYLERCAKNGRGLIADYGDAPDAGTETADATVGGEDGENPALAGSINAHDLGITDDEEFQFGIGTTPAGMADDSADR